MCPWAGGGAETFERLIRRQETWRNEDRMMKAITAPLLTVLFLAASQGAAMAQGDPATRACMQGEQEIGGTCQPLTRSPGRSSSGGMDSGNPGSTGSTGGGGSEGGQNSGGSGGQGNGGSSGSGGTGGGQ
jgi:hypothetical protein